MSFPFIILLLFLMLQPLCFTKISCSTFSFLFFYCFLLDFLISNKNLKNATLGIITVIIILFGYNHKIRYRSNKGIVFKKYKNK